MHDGPNTENPGKSVVSNRTMNMAVALTLMSVAMVVMVNCYLLGAGWEKGLGPQSGYFPFYIGLLLFISGSGVFVQHLLTRRADGEGSFIAYHELMMVLQVLIPTFIFVVLSVYIGIYISTAIFISYFMIRLGNYPLLKTIPVAIITPIALFLVFEVWFLVPLPKGPFEAWLGY